MRLLSMVTAPAPAPNTGLYRRRRPTATLLHRVMRENLETYLVGGDQADATGPSIPFHIEAAYRGYLKCGVLAHGFCRAYCARPAPRCSCCRRRSGRWGWRKSRPRPAPAIGCARPPPILPAHGSRWAGVFIGGGIRVFEGFVAVFGAGSQASLWNGAGGCGSHRRRRDRVATPYGDQTGSGGRTMRLNFLSAGEDRLWVGFFFGFFALTGIFCQCGQPRAPAAGT